AIVGEAYAQTELRRNAPRDGPVAVRDDALGVRRTISRRSDLQSAIGVALECVHIAAPPGLVQIVRILFSGTIGGTARHGHVLDGFGLETELFRRERTSWPASPCIAENASAAGVGSGGSCP